MKPSKCVTKEKKQGKRSIKQRGEENRKSQDCCVTFKPKKLSRNFASVHAQILGAGVLCLEQKAAKFLTYKQGFGMGLMLLAEKQLSTGSKCTGKQGAIEFKAGLTNK